MTATDAKSYPKIELPEGTVDIGDLLCQLNLHAGEPETLGALYSGLTAIEHGHPVLVFGSSNDHEYLLTSAGKIGLHGGIMRWLYRGKPVALATLWERHPGLRPYLRSRTQRFIALKEHELELLNINEGFEVQGIQRFQEELEDLDYQE